MWISKEQFKNLTLKAKAFEETQEEKKKPVDLPIFGKYFVAMNARGYWQFYRIDNLIKGRQVQDIIYVHTLEQAKSVIQNLDVAMEELLRIKSIGLALEGNNE